MASPRSGAVMMANALAHLGRRLDQATLERLMVIAAQDGRLDDEERAYMAALPWPAAQRHALENFFAACVVGPPPNPEVELMRRRDPHFDHRVQVLAEHARPGEIIAWTSDQPGFPWNIMRGAYGPWMHVSVVLRDGLLLDPYWPEGLTVSTIEAAVAKSFHRIKAHAFMITSLPESLSAEQLDALTDAAYAGLGKPYALVADLKRPCEEASCSRIAWDLFRAHGLDLAPEERRLYRTAISPVDLVHRPRIFVGVDGQLDPSPALPPPPDGPLAKAARLLDVAMAASQPFQDFCFGLQPPVIRLFMLGMASLGQERRPGFLPPEHNLRLAPRGS